ncbi:helix-turn-helix transcriptional regulator [Flindersiella endophytica]
MSTNDRRAALAAFLRSRRERLSPELVGLPAGSRRRTPGLRREEVAQLAGVGVTWYTWLEQGRSINPSRNVLDAIAQALRLNADERLHLFTLAELTPPAPVVSHDELTPVTQRVLEAVQPFPAVILSPSYQFVSWNQAYLHLMGDVGLLPVERRNQMRLIFVEPHWRTMLLDWDQAARHSVALYRGAMADRLDDPASKQLIDELTEQSPEFRDLWAEQLVKQPTTTAKLFLHPDVGLLRLDSGNFLLPDQPGLRMGVHTPSDEESAERLRRLPDYEPFAGWSEAVLSPSSTS